MEADEFRLAPQAITDEDRARRRLRDHVDRIVALAQVPPSALADLDEELYSHLWERWRASVDAGTPPEQAAGEAIASFGEAPSTATSLAAAYHSRLYVSTIGALVSLVAREGATPAAIDFLADYLRVVAAYDLFAGATYAVGLSPVRMAVALAATAIAVAFNLIAAWALDRGQRWALRYVQLLVPAVLVLGAVALFSSPRNDGAVVVAAVTLWMVPLTLGPAAAAWVAGAIRLGRPVKVGLSAALAMSIGGSAFASEIPDPTQVGPDALTVTVSLDCTSPTQATVTTDIVWSRTGFWTMGPFGYTHESVFVFPTDGAVGEGVTGYIAGSYATTLTDYPPGAAVASPPHELLEGVSSEATAWAWTQDANFLLVGSDKLQPRHRYRLTTTLNSEAAATTRVVVRYDHADPSLQYRFSKRADVPCGSTGQAVQVPYSAMLP